MDKDKQVSGFKKIVKILTFGLSGGEIFSGKIFSLNFLTTGDPEGPGCFALLLALLSVLLCLATLPLSLIFCVKVSQNTKRNSINQMK